MCIVADINWITVQCSAHLQPGMWVVPSAGRGGAGNPARRVGHSDAVVLLVINIEPPERQYRDVLMTRQGSGLAPAKAERC